MSSGGAQRAGEGNWVSLKEAEPQRPVHSTQETLRSLFLTQETASVVQETPDTELLELVELSSECILKLILS